MAHGTGTRKQRFRKGMLAAGEMDITQAARKLKTSRAVLVSLHERGELGGLFRPRGVELITTEERLAAWRAQPPRRAHMARRPKRSLPPGLLYDCKSKAEAWWLRCLWNRSLVGGLAWEVEVPESELLEAFRLGGGGDTADALFAFLQTVVPKGRVALPRRIRYRPRHIEDGEVRQGDRAWLVLASAEQCRMHWDTIRGDVAWHNGATEDPGEEKRRAERYERFMATRARETGPDDPTFRTRDEERRAQREEYERMTAEQDRRWRERRDAKEPPAS
jgi:hypothetical protein